VYNVQEIVTINDMAISIPKIYATVENRQEEHQDFVVELEGIFTKQPISILINLRSNISYVSP
jgi:hypothetical protein